MSYWGTYRNPVGVGAADRCVLVRSIGSLAIDREYGPNNCMFLGLWLMTSHRATRWHVCDMLAYVAVAAWKLVKGLDRASSPSSL